MLELIFDVNNDPILCSERGFSWRNRTVICKCANGFDDAQKRVLTPFVSN